MKEVRSESLLNVRIISQENMEESTVHDFATENKFELYLTGWIIPRKPIKIFILSVLLLMIQYGLHFFLSVTAGLTVYLTLDRRDILIKLVNPVSFVLIAMLLPVIKHSVRKSLDEAATIIRNGIFKYKTEKPFDTRYLMKRNRVSQIRFILSAFTKILYSSALFNIFVLPLLQWLTLQDSSGLPFNPYLPLPFHVPFDTESFHGYALAFVPHAVFFIFFYSSILCLEIVYASCAVQLIAHIEILNYSLENIEKTALEKYKEMTNKNEMKGVNLYENINFQKCIFLCLRETIQHHHAIIRFKNAICPYLEAINALGVGCFSILIASSIFLILEDPSNNVPLLIILITEIVSYFAVCFIGQVITDKSCETVLSLYSTPWAQCNHNFKVLLKIMDLNLKKPVEFRATGFNTISSLETFGNMMATGYKILSVLR